MVDENIAVAWISEFIALDIGYSVKKAQDLRHAAWLHDIGKQKISRSILFKNGKLTKDEFEVMKTHTVLGVRMMQGKRGSAWEMARAVCLWHHEWYNGHGYMGIKSGELPEYVPIVSISDVFVACCSKRSYKQAWSIEETLEHIHGLSGTQFSPNLTDNFIRFAHANMGFIKRTLGDKQKLA